MFRIEVDLQDFVIRTLTGTATQKCHHPYNQKIPHTNINFHKGNIFQYTAHR